MNELLGWYGYSNVDRNDLTKCSRFPTTTVHLEADLPASTGTSTHQVRQMRLSAATTTATSSVTAPSSRTTNSTPDRCNNSTSPESCGRHSKSPNVTTITNTTKLNDKLGWLCSIILYHISIRCSNYKSSQKAQMCRYIYIYMFQCPTGRKRSVFIHPYRFLACEILISD